MYALYSELKDRPIISLQTGEIVARLGAPVLDVTNFEILAYICHLDPGGRRNILMIDDIRQFAPDCIIIDDEDQLTEPEDIVRLAAPLQHDYTPLRQSVYSQLGTRLGVVEDYTINIPTNRIQRIHLRQAIWKVWADPGPDIDRSQIIDVTPDRIIVRDATVEESILPADSVPEIQP